MKGMGGVIMAALSGAMQYGGKVPFGGPPVGGVVPLAAIEKPKDPYHGIKSKGRNGAAGRAGQMAAIFDGTYIGKRNVRRRDVSRSAAHG